MTSAPALNHVRIAAVELSFILYKQRKTVLDGGEAFTVCADEALSDECFGDSCHALGALDGVTYGIAESHADFLG